MWLSPWSIFQTDTFPIKTCQVKGDWWSPWELEFYLLALVFSLLPSLGFLNVDIDTVCDEITIFRGEGAYPRILLVESTCYLAFGIFLDTITRRPLNNTYKIEMLLVCKDLHRTLSEYCVSIQSQYQCQLRNAIPRPLFSAPPRLDLIRFTSSLCNWHFIGALNLVRGTTSDHFIICLILYED